MAQGRCEVRPQTQNKLYSCIVLLGAALAVSGTATAQVFQGTMITGADAEVLSPPVIVDHRCIMSAACFTHDYNTSHHGRSRAEALSYKSSLDIGAYGPMQFKFYGNRVKIKWRF